MPRGISGGEPLDLTDASIEELTRFWKKTFALGEHRIWTGCVTHHSYGMAAARGRVTMATRVAKSFVTPLKAAEVVYSTCDVRFCVAPEHLTVGNASEVLCKRRREAPDSPYRAVQEARRRYADGATHDELLEDMEFSHGALIELLANRTWADEDYQFGEITRRRNHPELFRFTEEEIEEIREELANGTPLNRISRWLDAPFTTVWEAVKGPSGIARRAG